MVYHFRVHKEPKGHWAECLELPGCQTQADTRDGLLSNAIEALNLYLDEPEGVARQIPLPKRPAAKHVMNVPVDPAIAFSILLRNCRMKRRLTQKQVADRLGMRNLYSYQRLERRSNPNLATLRKLKTVFPDLSVDYVLQD